MSSVPIGEALSEYGEDSSGLDQVVDDFEDMDLVQINETVIRNSSQNCMELNGSAADIYVYGPLQLREHDDSATATTNVFTFTKPGADHIQIQDAPNAYYGQAWMFFTVSTSWIHNKYLRVSWREQSSWGTSYCYLIDGDYHRSSMVNFPDKSAVVWDGAGYIQTIRTLARPNSEVFDVQVNSSLATLDNCTIAFRVVDVWTGQYKNVDIFWIEINELSGGSNNLVSWNIDASATITMENTGTENDWGYMDGGDIEDYLAGGYLNPGYMVTEDYLNESEGSSLVLMTNTTIPSGTGLTVEFSVDNETWTDHENVTGATQIEAGFFSLDLRDINSPDLYIRYNFTGSASSTPRLYQSRLVSSGPVGEGDGVTVIESDTPWVAIAIILSLISALLFMRKR